MGAADPTYPLYPIASAISALMLLLVLSTSFIRQSWNLGVTFLCFWLFLESISNTANSVIWFNNADIKLYVYCDISSHLQEITFVVKPMATLIIIRRLYIIASLQSVSLPIQAVRRRNLLVEWTLGLGIPVLVAGPLNYINQSSRFYVYESLGCTNDSQTSVLEILTVRSWTVIPPLVSMIFYCPRVMRTFIRQRKDIHSFLNSNSDQSVSSTNYFRLLALASIDILLTFPISVVNIVLAVVAWTDNWPLPFYREVKTLGSSEIASLYFVRWTSPALAFAIFGLFGMTREARASYRHIISSVGQRLGWKSTSRAQDGRASLGEVDFSARPQGLSLSDVELGPRVRRPSFVAPEASAMNQDPERAQGERPPRGSVPDSSDDATLRSFNGAGKEESDVPTST